jgi:hypothetical protein
VIETLAVVVLGAVAGFLLGSRQDERRSTRDLRSITYVDLLVECTAEGEWLEAQMARAEISDIGGDPDDERFPRLPDDRLPPLERRRLGARTEAYGSAEVIRRWNRLASYGTRALLLREYGPAFRVEHGAMLDALRGQIRHEFERERAWFWVRWFTSSVAPDDYAKWEQQRRESQR